MSKERLLFVGVLFTISLAVRGQNSKLEYCPFAQDGKMWETQVGLIMENIYGNLISGDTLIGGESWKKVYNYVGIPKLNFGYYAAVRDLGMKVYVIAKGSSRPRLLYDFGLKVGEIVRCGIEGNAFGCLLDKDEQPDTLLGFPFVSYLRVERIDTIMACGMVHRRFKLSLLDSFRDNMRMSSEIVWVEGVGSGGGPFSPWMPLPPRDTFLQSCEVNRNCIFCYPDFYDAEVLTQIGSIRNCISVENCTYTLSGRRLPALPTQKGIYIKDERKVLIK